MSTSKFDTSGVFQTTKPETQPTVLSLPASSVKVSKNGIVFRSDARLAPWTEMTVDLHTGSAAKKIRCRGVIVECHGNRQAGYMVSMVFMSLSRQSQERLSEIAFSQLA